MTIEDFTTELFCCVDDKLSQRGKNGKHSQAKLYPSEVVTIAMLFALKGREQSSLLSLDSKQFQTLIPKITPSHSITPLV